jgi:hypothetical protein
MKKEDKILLKIYQDLYKASTPSADFDELMANAPLNERGQKVIDFNAYEITHEDYNRILEDILKDIKEPKWKKQMYRNTVAFGCSPKFKCCGDWSEYGICKCKNNG